MNREEIVKLAQQVQDEGFAPVGIWPEVRRLCELAYAAGAAAEREVCAQIAEEPSAMTYECTVACGGPEQTFQQRMPKHAHEIAKQIRARGQA